VSDRAAPTLELFFDYSSPFAYLASTQAERLAAETGATLVWRPFLLGALFKAIGTPLVPIASFPEPKRRYLRADMERWAAHWGVPLRFPSGFPLRTVDALRLTLAAGCPAPLIHRLFRALWVEDRAPDRATLAACLDDACPEDGGLDPALLERVDEPSIKDALREATQAAIDGDVPGAPTFRVTRGERVELFWGQDRLDFVRAALEGRAPWNDDGSPASPPAVK